MNKQTASCYLMQILLISVVMIYFGCSNNDNNKVKKPLLIGEKRRLANNKLFRKIRDNQMNIIEAGREMSVALKGTKTEYSLLNGNNSSDTATLVFPLFGYTLNSCVGENMDIGYVPGKYNLLEGNKHNGHAALDLFIKDLDQNSIDDNTGKPVPVLSLSEGVVVACEQSWDTLSELRGGKYIWIYSPMRNWLIYYAHCDQLTVVPGQIVKPGDKIGFCGRTGLNAYKKRSPTHLHLTILVVNEDFSTTPVNPYIILQKAHSATLP